MERFVIYTKLFTDSNNNTNNISFYIVISNVSKKYHHFSSDIKVI